MDSHDWSHTNVIIPTLNTELKNPKVKALEDELAPLFAVLPKDAAGFLTNGTANYALHRHFNQKYGWSIKGLEPAGASWTHTLSVTPDVKDVSKYMVPSYLQQLLAARSGGTGITLHKLAVLTAVFDHLIHAEMITIVYAIYTTLEIATPGKKTKEVVQEIIDTFLMVFAFGLNLDSTSCNQTASRRTLMACLKM